MREGWQTTKFNVLFNVGSAKRVLKAQWQSEGVPFYRGREITKLSNHGHVDNDLFISEELYSEYKSKYGVPSAGDIVITAIGTIGNSYIVREDDRFYYKDASVLCLKKISDTDSRFINYWLKSSQMKSQLEEGNGATVDTLTISKVKNLDITLPPLPEQKRIVAILDEAFEGIDAAIANTQKNLSNARELFDSYLNDVFINKGEGCSWQSLGDICELIDSLHKTPKYVEDGGYPMIRVTDIKNGSLNLAGAKRVSKDVFDEFSKRHKPNIGDIVLSRVGTYGVPALVTSHEQFCLGQNTVFIVPSSSINSKMLLNFLRCPASIRQIDELVEGTTQPTISLKNIKRIQIPVLSKKDQEKIVFVIEALSAKTNDLESNYQQKLEALNQLKQSLLAKAFSGELTADSEPVLKEAVG